MDVLLIKDGYGHWTWPKGNIEKNETSQRAAIREIGEEVGLRKVRLVTKVDKVQYFYRRSGNLIFKTVYIYLFEITGDEKLKVLKKEIDDARWFRPEDAVNKIEYRGAKKILRKAIREFQKTGAKG